MGKHCSRKLCTTQDPCSACQHIDDVGIESYPPAPWPDWLRPETKLTLEALDTWYDARGYDRRNAELALRERVKALRRARSMRVAR